MADHVQALGPGRLGLQLARLTLEQNSPFRRSQKSRHGAQQTGLARAISSRKGHGLARLNLKVQAREQPPLATNKT